MEIREILSMKRNWGRPMSVILLLIYILAGLGVHGDDDPEKLPLDVYCSIMISGTYTYSKMPRLEKYQRICRDVDSYIKCILENRVSRLVIPPFAVQPFERFFPSEYELARATYILCSQNLLSLQVTFDRDVFKCESQCDTAFCMGKYVTKDAVWLLDDETSLFPVNMDRVRNLSCKILAPLTNCIEMQYVNCDSKYEALKDYELGKLGGVCLASFNLHSRYVTKIACDSTSNNYNFQTEVAKMIAVVVIWFVTNM